MARHFLFFAGPFSRAFNLLLTPVQAISICLILARHWRKSHVSSHHRRSFHTGNPDFPRFIIADSQGEVWNGQSWSSDGNDALLYASPGHVSVDCANLQRQETLNKPHLLTATIPIRIEAFSDVPLDPDVLKAWLHKALSLNIDFRSGSGPTPDSIVLATLVFSDWTDTTPSGRCDTKGKP